MLTGRIFAIGVLMFLSVLVRAQDPDPNKTNYLLFPAKKEKDLTELQRSFLAGDKVTPKFTVLINGSAAIREDKTIDPKRIDLPGLQKAWRDPVGIRVGDEKYRVVITIAYFGRTPSEEGREMLYWALKGMALDSRYEIIDVSSLFESGDGWNRAIEGRKAYDLVKEGQAGESAVGNDLVAVYPVRTAWSRHVLGGADCLVDIKTPLDKESKGKLTDKQEEIIVQSIDKLKLSSKKLIRFNVKVKFGATGVVDRFYDETAKELAKKLGFDKHSVGTQGTD